MNERIRYLMMLAISESDRFNDPDTQNMYVPHIFAEKFTKLVVADCSEMVRGVLREEGSTLSYKDATTLQERFKEAFDIKPDWSEP